MADLARRVELMTPQFEALASAGAFASLDLTPREALWEAGRAAQEKPEYLPGTSVWIQPPLLPILTAAEQVVYDLWTTGISTDDHPVRSVRNWLDHRGVVRIDRLETAESGRRIEVGGVVIHRQRPSSARGRPRSRGADR